jgi:hypothetical protein
MSAESGRIFDVQTRSPVRQDHLSGRRNFQYLLWDVLNVSGLVAAKKRFQPVHAAAQGGSAWAAVVV